MGSQNQCLSVDEAAARLAVRPSTLLKWSRLGKIESVRLGRRRVFREAVIEAFIAVGIQPATGGPQPGERTR